MCSCNVYLICDIYNTYKAAGCSLMNTDFYWGFCMSDHGMYISACVQWCSSCYYAKWTLAVGAGGKECGKGLVLTRERRTLIREAPLFMPNEYQMYSQCCECKRLPGTMVTKQWHLHLAVQAAAAWDAEPLGHLWLSQGWAVVWALPHHTPCAPLQKKEKIV